MTETRCSLCGAELLPATSFCRQCGSAISDTNAEGRSEAPTALLSNPPESSKTQRLDPRKTSPGPGFQVATGTMKLGSAASGRRRVVVVGFVVVLTIVVVTMLAVMRKRNAISDAGALLYPAAHTVLDMTGTDGSRTVHLQTKDPLGSVESWYQSNLKLSKTVRLTSNSVVMKKETVTITLAVEDGTTNILIKQAP